MAKRFNDVGVCIPEIHYMVDMTPQLNQIKEYVDAGEYFVINRGRQYGKTTTLRSLKKLLQEEYLVIALDFQVLGAASFDNENRFSLTFGDYFLETILTEALPLMANLEEALSHLRDTIEKEGENFLLFNLFRQLSKICELSDKSIVLMIDEVDNASNNQIFLDFLAQLRGYYLSRFDKATFHSVILASVHDIRNLRIKLRPNEERRLNSPWNIAASFDVDISLSIEGIHGMLTEYEKDHHTKMNLEEIATLIYEHTSGYPYLVSVLCKIMDETIFGSKGFPTPETTWTKDGFLAAVRLLLNEKNALFESLAGKITDFPEFQSMLLSILFTGKAISYSMFDPVIDLATMYGFIQNKDGYVVIANRIFEMILYNMLLSTKELQRSDIYKASLQDTNQFIQHGYLNMRLVLEKFVAHFHELYGDCDEKFIEEDGRKYFLLYLKPIINGIGNYYVESRTRDLKRTDVIVDYHGQQYIIEMKIWRGDEYKQRGREQLLGYLDDYRQDTGYMLSFNFNKHKKVGVHEINIDGKKIIEAVV